MRTTILITAILFLAQSEVSLSQIPTYELRATNFTPLHTVANSIEFDVVMTWTNPGIAPNFEYAGGRSHFNFNASIANGGTLTYEIIGSDLPINLIPRNPQVFTSSIPAQLRQAVNTFPGAGSGYQIPADSQVLITKVRLSTSASQFANIEEFGIQWRDSLPNPFTKFFAYVGTTNTDISNRQNHFMDFPFSMSLIDVKVAIEGIQSDGQHVSKDSVKILLRSSLFPYSIIDSNTSVLDSSNLTASITVVVPLGNYYIAVKHKNSLETWSKAGGEQIGSGYYFYDFTSDANKAYGNNLILKDGLYCIYSGNINQDDIIDADDMLLIDNDLLNFASGNSITNLNGDGIVDIDDLAICDKNARELISVQRP